MMEAVRTTETSVDNYFTRQYNPEDNSEHRLYICVRQTKEEVKIYRDVIIKKNVNFFDHDPEKRSTSM
jgi:hypothetical protein